MKVCGRRPFKKPELKAEGCIPHILLGSFLNTLSHMRFIVGEPLEVWYLWKYGNIVIEYCQ